jgi:hypothetical protein
MGMSSHVMGFRPTDEKWKEMKKIFDACTEAGISVPEEVEEFFDWEGPKEHGIKVELDNYTKPYSPHEMAEGVIIELSNLPKSITHICFYNSW